MPQESLAPEMWSWAELGQRELQAALEAQLELGRPVLMVCPQDSCAQLDPAGVPVRVSWRSLLEARQSEDESWSRHTHPFCPRCSEPGQSAGTLPGKWRADHREQQLDP